MLGLARLEFELEFEFEFEFEFEKNASLSDSRKRLPKENDERFLICLLSWKFLNMEYRSRDKE